ncbi:MAG: biopolymer transporter ExbB [Neptuniibacter caesariensis]|uniref:Biopolymer transporter ExbB n=1 Tax=Neptuniibacter caesariensis TaxID=207954 RepID=A0A2G6JPB0_NEPCE|nr:MAG: biopolymer transporter ExbB [Neptuniibacter caesariensis]
MNILTLAQQQLGPLSLPLLTCSVVALLILLERTAILCYYTLRRSLRDKGLGILDKHREYPRATRDEIAAIWLHNKQRKLGHGIRMLQIIALIAPLLGLLGTVIGLIQVFDALGGHHGPIEPAMLAEGLGIAMKTTAMGLIIAVPAVIGAHGFQLWVDKLVALTEQAINMHNLHIDGVCTEELT